MRRSFAFVLTVLLLAGADARAGKEKINSDTSVGSKRLRRNDGPYGNYRGYTGVGDGPEKSDSSSIRDCMRS